MILCLLSDTLQVYRCCETLESVISKVSFPTSPLIPPVYTYFYDVTHNTFQRFHVVIPVVCNFCHFIFRVIKIQDNENYLTFQRTVFNTGRIGQWAVYYTSPQSLITFIIGWLNNSIQTLIVIYKKGQSFIIIGNVHQFIVHCLIPLDLWYKTRMETFMSSEAHISKSKTKFQHCIKYITLDKSREKIFKSESFL